MEKKKVSLTFRIIKSTVALFCKKMKIYGGENIPESGAVIVGNHSQMTGPICAELYLGDNSYIWCAGQMMNLKEVPSYAYEDFWSGKPKILRPFFKLLSYVIAPLSVCVFNNARTVGVYHDMRILSTFRNSLELLKNGANLVIFPEKHETYNNILYKFNDKFTDVARHYYNSTKKKTVFVPMYICRSLGSIHFGKPIEYNPENDKDAERERICSYLSETITDIAVSLPEHRVVPYSNIPKKQYLSNKDITEVPE